MIVGSIKMEVYARCEQFEKVITNHSMFSKLFANHIGFANDKMRVVIKGEVKDRIIDLRYSVKRDGGATIIHATNDLGLDALRIELSCTEIDEDKAHISVYMVMNPVGLGVSLNLSRITLQHIAHGFEKRLLEVLRSVPVYSDRLVEEAMLSRAIIRGSLVHRSKVGTQDLDIIGMATRYSDRPSVLIMMRGDNIEAKAMIVGSIYGLKAVIEGKEITGDRVVDEVRKTGKEVELSVYDISKVVRGLTVVEKNVP